MKKVLFVDDEKDLHPIVHAFFPRDQFRVIFACDGLEGMQKCRNEDFDFIIADFQMPKLDGVKFYHQLRDLQEARKVEPTPIIFISGMIEEVRAKELIFVKCEFLDKPFSKEELFQKMERINAPKIESKIVLNPGDVLFNEGDKADCVYYVIKGQIENSINQKVIGKVGAGELFGEMDIIINFEKRLCTATAVERTELVKISSDKVLSIVGKQPKWIRLMIENLSKRLRDTIKQIA